MQFRIICYIECTYSFTLVDTVNDAAEIHLSINFLFHDDAGRVGRISLALSDMLRDDIKSGPDRIPVPYS
jgi:hypothetical protein